MQSIGLAALCAAVLVGTVGCGSSGSAPPVPVIRAAAPMAPVNVNEALVSRTLAISGLVPPYRVVAIHLGVLGDLEGFSAADRAATAAWQGTVRSELDLPAWKVTMVGAQPTDCGPGACPDQFRYVEAYLTQDLRGLFGITMRELPPGDPLIPAT